MLKTREILATTIWKIILTSRRYLTRGINWGGRSSSAVKQLAKERRHRSSVERMLFPWWMRPCENKLSLFEDRSDVEKWESQIGRCPTLKQRFSIEIKRLTNVFIKHELPSIRSMVRKRLGRRSPSPPILSAGVLIT